MTHTDWVFVASLMAFVALWLLLYRRIVACILTGRAWQGAVLTALTSPVMLLFLAMFGENRPFSDFTDLSVMPWSVVFGDGLVLPAAVFVAAKSAPAWYTEPLAADRWWARCCLVVGLAAGLGFHQFDGNGYRKSGHGNLVSSLTKDWHDVAVYSIFVGMLLFVLVFVLKFDRPHRWAFLALLGVQLVLMAIDGNRGLNPPDMHSACDIVCGAGNLSGHLHDAVGTVRGWLQEVHLLNG